MIPRNKPRIGYCGGRAYVIGWNPHKECWVPIISVQCERDELGRNLPRMWELYCQHVRDTIRALAA